MRKECYLINRVPAVSPNYKENKKKVLVPPNPLAPKSRTGKKGSINKENSLFNK